MFKPEFQGRRVNLDFVVLRRHRFDLWQSGRPDLLEPEDILNVADAYLAYFGGWMTPNDALIWSPRLAVNGRKTLSEWFS